MRIAFLGGIFPQENICEILANSHGVVQSAADALQKSILEGLGAYRDDIDIINLPFLGSYPKRYNKLFTPSNDFEVTSHYGRRCTIKGKNESYCNLSLLKYQFIEHTATKSLLAWARHYSKEEKVIIAYSLFSPFLISAIKIRNRFPDTKILCIVPDLPQFMSAGGKSLLRKMFKDYSTRKTEKFYDKIDGFIILSKYMVEPLRIGAKPYAVVEGIYNSLDEQFTVSPSRTDKEKIVLYAGTLARRYGILRLLTAFTSLADQDIKLIICGEGDAKEDIEKIAANDKRIILKGNIPRKEVLDLISHATVLVNPRTPEGEFTKYSFPSKTMEYLASGTPTILYKLPAMDDEYFRHCIALEDLSIEALTFAISQVLSMDEHERNRFGKQARDFILSKKNPEIQCKKIINVISDLFSTN